MEISNQIRREVKGYYLKVINEGKNKAEMMTEVKEKIKMKNQNQLEYLFKWQGLYLILFVYFFYCLLMFSNQVRLIELICWPNVWWQYGGPEVQLRNEKKKKKETKHSSVFFESPYIKTIITFSFFMLQLPSLSFTTKTKF